MPKVSLSQGEEITAEQIKAARAALNVPLAEVAERTNIGIATLKRYEAVSGVPKSRKGHLSTLKSFYETAGIEFIGSPDDRPGIRIGLPKHANHPD